MKDIGNFKMSETVSKIAKLMLIFSLLLPTTSAIETDDWKDTSEVSAITVAAVVCISLLLIVFIISLCGGCTPMEVGSDDHAAAGGRKSYTQYSSVATDVNTHVMSSGTTLPNDPYTPNDQALPYALHPQTAQNFTGYQAQGNQPTGAGTQGYNAQQGYQIAGANRHFSESEPPPPNYFEAVQSGTPGQSGQPSAPAQQYGW